MRLLSRLADIVSANLNELIERYEDPELLLKQAVCEMDESLRAALENAVKVVAHEKLLARQLAEEEAAVTAWHAASGSRRTARRRGGGTPGAAAEAGPRGRRRVAGETTGRSDRPRGKRCAATSKPLRLRTDEAKRKLTLLAARQRAAAARQRLLREFNAAPLGDEAFAKFERMCRKVEQTEAEAEALAELSGRRARRSQRGCRQPTSRPS